MQRTATPEIGHVMPTICGSVSVAKYLDPDTKTWRESKAKFDKDVDFLVFNEKCVGCMYCVQACAFVKTQTYNVSKSRVSVERDYEARSHERYIVKFLETCDSCGFCLEYCYFDAIRNVQHPHEERTVLPDPGLSKTQMGL